MSINPLCLWTRSLAPECVTGPVVRIWVFDRYTSISYNCRQFDGGKTASAHTRPRACERQHTQGRGLVSVSTRLRARSRAASSQSSPPVALTRTPATGFFNKKSKSWGVIGAMSAASPRAPTAGAGSTTVLDPAVGADATDLNALRACAVPTRWTVWWSNTSWNIRRQCSYSNPISFPTSLFEYLFTNSEPIQATP